MIISYNRIQSYIKEPLPSPEVLAELITAKLFEIEEQKPVGNDVMFDIKVLADRASYCYGHAFIAREIAVITHLTYQPIEYRDPFNDTHASPDHRADIAQSPRVQIGDEVLENTCVLYQARAISGIQNHASPAWLSDFLNTVGQRSINYIVDLTNFVMLDIGQPMHAFDAQKVTGALEVRYARAGESIELLDGRTIIFDTVPTLVIADEVGPLALAGVKGGKRAEVTSDTTDIFLESANFNGTYVRKTAERFGIKNDSTKRFENNVSLERVARAMAEFSHIMHAEQPQVCMSSVVCVENNNVVVERTAPRTMSFSA